jgi:hypothetical protein
VPAADAPKPSPAPTPDRPPTAEPAEGIPTLAIVFGAVGVAALGSFVYFAVDAKSDVDDLEDTCAPGCDQSDVDRASRKALIADISLGVGVVALAAAGWVVFVRPESDASSSQPRGGFVGVGGRF